ncbi:MAG: glucose-6-phosphate isomerase [Candidatus Binatia bacterium]|jgi:glucose-6-phosphate isomerase
MAQTFRGRRRQEPEPVRIDLNGVFSSTIGAASGIHPEELATLRPRLASAIATLQSERAQGLHPFLDLPQERDALGEMLSMADQLRDDVDHFVVLGIGGSARGARALAAALDATPRGKKRDAPELIVADNIDPASFARLLDELDLSRTVFNVISKSGETSETMAQFLIVRERLLRELGAMDYVKHIIVTTDAESGSLRQIVNDEGFPSTSFPGGVSGRFSALSSVHLLPVALLGIDVEQILDGAAFMDQRCRDADPEKNPAALLAGVRYLLDVLHGVPTAVLMPYSDRLVPLADWWCQLWAESLGKRVERDGGRLSIGQTPVRAIGAADQHSQMQLYLDGPADKVITFVRVADAGVQLEIPRSYPDLVDVAYLGGHELGELLVMEQRAMELALNKRGRPTIAIEMPHLTPFTIGQLVYLMEVETALTASLFGIDPFNQPAVEEGKRLTFGLAGKPGYEDEREEIERWLAAKLPERVV